MKLKFFDLHCDTIQKIVEKGCDFTSASELHLNLPGILSSNLSVQVFACFIYDSGRFADAFDACNAYIDAIEELIRIHNDRLVLATSSKTLSLALASRGKTAVIIAVEGATPLMGKVERLEHFYQRGVRLLTISWDDNEFCGSVFGDNSGLTPLGEQLVRHCNVLGVALDVSHASDKAFYDMAAITEIPFLASHSNARKICPNNRNLTDDMIRIIAQRGGLIGLVFGSGFISPEYYQHERANRDRVIKGLKDKTMTFKEAGEISRKALAGVTNAPLSLLVKHAKHMINVGGEDCLGLGSDFDGVDSLPQSMAGVQSLPLLVMEMENQGISSRMIEKICYQNSYRFFSRILKEN